jgi:hypothetical protein
MKRPIFYTCLCAAIMSLISCNEDGQTSTVSKSLWSNDTIVSNSSSNGTFTRTQYGNDFWGNREITVSRGHANATQQGDLLEIGVKLGIAILSEHTK